MTEAIWEGVSAEGRLRVSGVPYGVAGGVAGRLVGGAPSGSGPGCKYRLLEWVNIPSC